ncbi:MAG: hypothetical protein ACYCY2_03400 [Acidithiobacillus ferriphilus]
METMRGTAFIYKGGDKTATYSTLIYDSTEKSASHIQGAIVKDIKQAMRNRGADYADVFIHYSTLPMGPFCTRGIGKVQP